MLSEQRRNGPWLSITPDRSDIAVDEEVTFTCNRGQDSDPDYNHFSFYHRGELRVNQTSNKWGPMTLAKVRSDSGNYSCAVSNALEESQISEELHIDVQGI